MGQWTGTSGSLAADVHWLLFERSKILRELQTMQDANIDTQGPLLDPDQVIAEDDDRTPEYPLEAVSGMSMAQMEAAWAGIKARVQERQESLRQAVPAKPSEAVSESERLLAEASEAVRDRRRRYGPPTEHFRRTVGAINAIFAHKLREPLTEEDWPQIMLLDKLARHQEQPQRDNPVDAAGYSACWAETMALRGRPEAT